MELQMRKQVANDFVEVKMGDHEFSAWLRKRDKNWSYESFDIPPGTYFIVKGEVLVVAFYNNAKSTHKLFFHKKCVEKIDILRGEANQSCKFREHIMGWDTPNRSEKRTTQIGHCVNCGKEVILDTNPPPNGIDIGGEAVALNCRD